MLPVLPCACIFLPCSTLCSVPTRLNAWGRALGYCTRGRGVYLVASHTRYTLLCVYVSVLRVKLHCLRPSHRWIRSLLTPSLSSGTPSLFHWGTAMLFDAFFLKQSQW